jgi:hypothetical protein
MIYINNTKLIDVVNLLQYTEQTKSIFNQSKLQIQDRQPQ